MYTDRNRIISETNDQSFLYRHMRPYARRIRTRAEETREQIEVKRAIRLCTAQPPEGMSLDEFVGLQDRRFNRTYNNRAVKAYQRAEKRAIRLAVRDSLRYV